MNEFLDELNGSLKGSVADRLLSDLGRRVYLPRGIIVQSAEAKEKAVYANGTIGMMVKNGEVVRLKAIEKALPTLSAAESVAYSPTMGVKAIREEWKNSMIKKNPRLKSARFSLPIVTPGLTAALSYASELFFDSSTSLILPSPYWENYALIAETRRGTSLINTPMFKNGSLNVEGIKDAILNEADKNKTVRLLLNFPHNPSGYSPVESEATSLCAAIKTAAEKGSAVLVIVDDSYFGLSYEEEIEKHSLFNYLCDIHENVLVVKIDGATKEDFVWGFRVGFITFASKGLNDDAINALEQKTAALIRSAVSCASSESQNLILQSWRDEKSAAQKRELFEILKKRYLSVKKFLSEHKSRVLEALPFNSGYFMSFKVNEMSAVSLQAKLLREQGVGTVAIDDETLRLAFSSIDEEKIEGVLSRIFSCADEMK